MRTRNLPLAEAVILAALLSLIAIAATAAPRGPQGVVFTGWLRVEDRNVNDLVLVVEVADQCLYAEVLPNGRFILAVPAGAQAVLAFIKPGHLIKEIAIDTRNSAPDAKAARKQRTVKFDVVLEPEQKRPGRHYDGPVGSLGFHKGTGTTKVRHTLNVVAAPQQAGR